MLDTNNMLAESGLNWGVSKRPVHYTTETGEQILVPDRYALVRDDTGAFLSEVGDRWEPLQNHDMVDMVRQLAEIAESDQVELLPYQGGRLVVARVQLMKSTFQVSVGDVVEARAVVVSPHIGGRSIQAFVETLRLVCGNGMRASSKALELRRTHIGVLDQTATVEAISVASEQVVTFASNAATLKKLQFSDAEVLRLLAPIYQPGDPVDAVVAAGADGANPSLRSVMSAYREAPGADPGTGWGVLNAVTYHADHVAGRDEDQRAISALVGGEADRKQRVLASLLEVA